MNLQTRTIAVIGLGYVGLPLAVEFAKKRPVIGFDIKANRISELQAGNDHTLEVSEDELGQAKHLIFTADKSSLRASPSSRSLATTKPSLRGALQGDVAISAQEPMIFIVREGRSIGGGKKERQIAGYASDNETNRCSAKPRSELWVATRPSGHLQ